MYSNCLRCGATEKLNFRSLEYRMVEEQVIKNFNVYQETKETKTWTYPTETASGYVCRRCEFRYRIWCAVTAIVGIYILAYVVHVFIGRDYQNTYHL